MVTLQVLRAGPGPSWCKCLCHSVASAILARRPTIPRLLWCRLLCWRVYAFERDFKLASTWTQVQVVWLAGVRYYALWMAEKEALGGWRFELLWFKIKPCQKIKITSLSQWRACKTPLPLLWIDPSIFRFQRCTLTHCISNPWLSTRTGEIPDETEVDFRVYIALLDRHVEQLRKFWKAMDNYIVLSVTRNRLYMFDNRTALVYEQTRSSQPAVLLS